MRASSSREKGSTMLEFALTVSLFLVMLFGIVDFGRALYTYHFLSNAAREATRYAAVHGYTCNDDNSCSVANPDTGPANSMNTVIQDYVQAIIPSGINSSQVTTTPTWPVQANSPTICGSRVNGSGPYANYPGCTVQVKVSYPFGFLVPLVHSGSITLSSTSEMIISH
jgi:Flp pilus assembly protein TadG